MDVMVRNDIYKGNINYLLQKIDEISDPIQQKKLSLLKAFCTVILFPQVNHTPTKVGGDPLLLWACDKEMPNMAMALLGPNATPDVKGARDVNGDTPALVACDRGLIDVTILLINDKAVDLDSLNNLGMTLLSICDKRKDIKGMDTVRSLLISKMSSRGGNRRLRLKQAAE